MDRKNARRVENTELRLQPLREHRRGGFVLVLKYSDGVALAGEKSPTEG